MSDEKNTTSHDDHDDVVVESEDSGTDGFGRTKKETDLKAKLKDAEAKAAEHLEGWQRAKADLINFKKENEQRQASVITFATAGLIEEFLPVLDSFEMAMANKDVWESVDQNWRVGVEHILSQIKTVLNGRGLQELNPVGTQFDPMRHEPVENVSVENADQDGIIQKVIQQGYTLHDKVIRPAKVVVGSYDNE